MDRKIIWLCLAVGSTAGSYIPSLWGAGSLSFSGLIFGALGGLAGIWVGYRVSE